MRCLTWVLIGTAFCVGALLLVAETLQARSLVMLHDKFSSSAPTVAVVQQTKCSQQPTAPPETHNTLNLVVEEMIQKPWQDNDPQICVLVSTYIKHGLRLTALIASLLSSGYPYMDVILLDTDTTRNSTQWMVDTAKALNSRSNVPSQRETVHLSQYTQRYIQERYPHVTSPDYGYLLSDVILYEELDIMPGLPKCDYIMLTNGDNLYSSSLVSATMEFMREQIDLIGFEFTSRYEMNNTTKVVDHPFRKDQVAPIVPASAVAVALVANAAAVAATSSSSYRSGASNSAMQAISATVSMAAALVPSRVCVVSRLSTSGMQQHQQTRDERSLDDTAAASFCSGTQSSIDSVVVQCSTAVMLTVTITSSCCAADRTESKLYYMQSLALIALLVRSITS
eukprot:15091-Heterococcus_DN1.PRE.1